METRYQNYLIEMEEKFISEDVVEIEKHVRELLQAERKIFNLEINFPDGFTGEVMRQISEIGYDETATYGEIAEDLDSSAVAVGQACGRNPVPLVIPCHRVVGEDSIGGYRFGRELKKKLLDLEERNRGS